MPGWAPVSPQTSLLLGQALRPKAFDLLAFLASHPGEVLAEEKLLIDHLGETDWAPLG